MSTIKNLLADYKDKKLSSSSTKLNRIFAYDLDADKAYDLGNDTKIKIGGEAGADVLLINESNEADAALDTERVFNLPRQEEADAFKFLTFIPLIEFDTDAAWLRYRLFANVHVGVGAANSSIGVSLDANAEISATYYQKHATVNADGKAVTIKDALIEDVLSVPNVFEKNAVINDMNAGDALSLRIAGGLALGVEVNLSDLLSGAVAGSGVFSGLIGVRYSAGANFSATATVTDEFILIIAKSASNRFDVAYRKTESISLSASAELGIKADLDPTSLKTLANEAIANVAEIATPDLTKLIDELNVIIANGHEKITEKIEQILSKTSNKALKKLLPKLANAPFEKLEDIFGQPDEFILDQVKKLQEALGESIDKLFESLRSKGKSTLELAIGLEYSRIRADRDIMRFNCDQATLQKLRTSLVRMDLNKALTAIRKAEASNRNNIQLVNYLREQSLVKQRGFSIGFSLFGWNLKTSRETRFSENILRDLSVRPPEVVPVLRVALETTRTGEQLYTRQRELYSVSFGAHSRDNALAISGPSTDELDYTLGAAATYESKSINDAADLHEFLDTGIIYGALGGIDVNETAEALYNQIKTTLKPNTKISIHAGVTVNGELSRQVIDRMAAHDVDLLAAACAVAMSWFEHFESRQNVELRKQFYTPIFREYISRPHHSNAMWRSILQAQLTPLDRRLARFEKNYANGSNNPSPYKGAHMDYFLGTITQFRGSVNTGELGQRKNSFLRQDIIDMAHAAQILSDSWARGSSYKLLKQKFHHKMLGIWGNEFSGRFFGAYLNLLVADLGHSASSAEFERLFRVSFTNKKNKSDCIDLVAV